MYFFRVARGKGGAESKARLSLFTCGANQHCVWNVDSEVYVQVF